MQQFPPPGSHLNRRPGPLPSPLAPPAPPPPVLLFDLDTTMRFLRSASLCRAMAESCNLEWKTYDDSMVINAIYTLMPWKEKPGGVDVKMASKAELQERYGWYLQRMVSNWTTAMFMGPASVKAFLDKVDAQRNRDRGDSGGVESGGAGGAAGQESDVCPPGRKWLSVRRCSSRRWT